MFSCRIGFDLELEMEASCGVVLAKGGSRGRDIGVKQLTANPVCCINWNRLLADVGEIKEGLGLLDKMVQKVRNGVGLKLIALMKGL
uniref:Uncharacterized protein n=1 Tax=Leersia perrieri TaxID=77586 RepID=A0A0D9XBV6_9ORYZ